MCVTLAGVSLLRTAVPPPRGRRLAQLYAGLLLYGVSASMLLLAGLGVDPWDVLHQGLSRRLGMGVGTWAVIAGLLVMLLWIPLRQRPGYGTLNNVVIVGLVMDAVMASVSPPHAMALRVASLLAGVVLNGIATGLYIGAGLGPGPRDGLMTGLAARGYPLRVVRWSIEATVLVAGWLLGGTVGIGTLVYALGIGALVHVFVPRLAIGPAPEVPPAALDSILASAHVVGAHKPVAGTGSLERRSS
ncbi:MAG: membrane protein YczE [Solirubrobacteraceae bacterium]